MINKMLQNKLNGAKKFTTLETSQTLPHKDKECFPYKGTALWGTCKSMKIDIVSKNRLITIKKS